MTDSPRSGHQHTEEEERRIREADKTLQASFPASDPPSTDPNPDQHEALEESDASDSPSSD